MSGPVGAADAGTNGPTVEVLVNTSAEVGGTTVRRALPRRAHRTIGAWCFLDHFGPHPITPATAMQIGPHPHIGLHTVTWLLEGEALHTDSLGSEQLIRPGQLNLMTAGNGIAHAEDGRDRPVERSHGVQLWVAQPGSTRFGPSAFEHHAELPELGLSAPAGTAGGRGGRATVLVGALGDVRSPARADTPLLGVDLALDGPVELPLDPTFEHGIAVLTGGVAVDGTAVGADELGYLGLGRSGVVLEAVPGTRAVLLGGEPFESEIVMWWNFVARSRDEVTEAFEAWQAGDPRFGEVRTTLGRIDAPRPSWLS